MPIKKYVLLKHLVIVSKHVAIILFHSTRIKNKKQIKYLKKKKKKKKYTNVNGTAATWTTILTYKIRKNML